MKIGVIGLGNIGGAIAHNLVEDGHKVAVYDVDSSRAATLAEAGATALPSTAALGAASELTFASLPTPEAVEKTAAQWVDTATPDSVFVDLSTNAPDVVRRIGATLRERKCHLLEAPLTGGAPGAQARQLVFMVGGAREIYARARPVLDRLGRATFHLGELGLGNTAKLVNSLMAFSATWCSLEGLAIGAKAGIDVRTMVDVIRTSGTGNVFIDRMVEGINQRGRPPAFALALASKDAGLLVDLARGLAVPASVTAQIAQTLVAAVGAGLGQRDYTDWVELAERQSGVELRIAPGKP